MTSNVNNQGIMHLSGTRGGFPMCRNKRAHMSTVREHFEIEQKQCKKCAAILAKWKAKGK